MLVDRCQWPARRLMIFGLHVHVGIESGEKAIAVFNSLTTYLPHLLALSASSPFFNSQDTGLTSCRVKVFESLPTAGLPYRLLNWGEFQRLMTTLVNARAIESIREVWWDVRPHPEFGTVEVRICDGLPTLDDIVAMTAMIQALVVWLGEQYDEGSYLPLQRYWIVRENKWRAARWALDADLIVDEDGRLERLSDGVERLLEALDPVAARLGSSAEIGRIRTPSCATGRATCGSAGCTRIRAASPPSWTRLWRTSAEALRSGRSFLPCQAVPDALQASQRSLRRSRVSGTPKQRDRCSGVSTSRMGPEACTRPPASSSAWVNAGGISSTWWVTITMDGGPPAAATAPSKATSCSRPPRSSPAVGSSSSHSAGSLISVRASSTRWRSPDESVPSAEPASAPQPKRSSRARALRRSAAVYWCHQGASAAYLPLTTTSSARSLGCSMSASAALVSWAWRRSSRVSVRPRRSPSTSTAPREGCR